MEIFICLKYQKIWKSKRRMKIAKIDFGEIHETIRRKGLIKARRRNDESSLINCHALNLNS